MHRLQLYGESHNASNEQRFLYQAAELINNGFHLALNIALVIQEGIYIG